VSENDVVLSFLELPPNCFLRNSASISFNGETIVGLETGVVTDRTWPLPRRVNQQRAVPRAEVGCELGSNILRRAAFLSSQESFFEVPSNFLFTAFADNCPYIPLSLD
jgi:hypothetical protein